MHDCRHTLGVNRSLRCLCFHQRALAEYGKVSENVIVFRRRKGASAAAASGLKSTSPGALGKRLTLCPIFNDRSTFIETKHVRQNGDIVDRYEKMVIIGLHQDRTALATADSVDTCLRKGVQLGALQPMCAWPPFQRANNSSCSVAYGGDKPGALRPPWGDATTPRPSCHQLKIVYTPLQQ